MSSLRGRLTVRLLTGSGVMLVAVGLLLDRRLSTRLRAEYDAALIAEARSLETSTEQQGARVWLDFADEVRPEFAARENPAYFQLWLADGRVLERSRSLGTKDLPRSGGQLDRPVLRDLRLPDGRQGRAVEITFRPLLEEDEMRGDETAREGPRSAPTGPAAILVVAQGREDLDAFLAAVHGTLALGILGLLAGSALLVKTVVGRGLLPLDDLARQLESMDARTLGAAVETPDAPAELVPVIAHLNGLLARLKGSFERERAFSANLAHELRTPLAELRAAAEVALKWPDDAPSWSDSFEEVHAIGLQMERIVFNLLALARYESGQHALATSTLALGEVVARCWSAAAAAAAARGMAFRSAIPADLTIVTDREKLSLILANLLSNAVAHGSPGQPVTCSAAAVGDRFTFTVRNATNDLAVADLAKMFDRFWRRDSARSGDGHAGLGLALVGALCELLELEKEVRLVDGAFEITLLGRLAGPLTAPGQT